MGELVDFVIFEIAENITAENMGLTIPAPALVQVAGALEAPQVLARDPENLLPGRQFYNFTVVH